MSLNLKAIVTFYFTVGSLFSKVQYNKETKDEANLLRMLTPLMKLYTSKIALSWVSEGIEALGALGYMENSNVPVFLRDTQVLTIWEGTTNVLCLDFLRAITSTKNSQDPL